MRHKLRKSDVTLVVERKHKKCEMTNKFALQTVSTIHLFQAGCIKIIKTQQRF